MTSPANDNIEIKGDQAHWVSKFPGKHIIQV